MRLIPLLFLPQALSASVKSIEDHGYILDTGLKNFPAFLSFKDSESDGLEQAFSVGAPVDVIITKLSDNGRTCNVKVSRSQFASSLVGN